jgi:hypothetical protein
LLERAYNEGDRRRRALLAVLTPEMIRRWRQEPPTSIERHQIAFLGSHPRSGTTLLEQILDAHPEVLAFDEPVAFSQEITSQINLSPLEGEAQLNSVDTVPQPRRAKMRRPYIKSLLREIQGEPAARILLDKNPSPTMSLNVRLRVFPARAVLRDGAAQGAFRAHLPRHDTAGV